MAPSSLTPLRAWRRDWANDTLLMETALASDHGPALEALRRVSFGDVPLRSRALLRT